MRVLEVVSLDTCCPNADAWERRLTAIRDAFDLADENGLGVFGLFDPGIDFDADLVVVAPNYQSAIEAISDAHPGCWSCYTVGLTRSDFWDAPQNENDRREATIKKLKKARALVLRLKHELGAVKLPGEQRHIDAACEALGSALSRIDFATTPVVKG